MLIRNMLSLSIFAFILISCNQGTNPDDSKNPNQVRDLKPSEQQIVQASKAFGLKLMRRINLDQSEENIFISPLSVSMALGMTMNGAAGETYDEMKATLEFGDLSEEEINQAYLDLMTLLPGIDKEVLFQIANSIWYRDSYPVLESFKDVNRKYFAAEVSGMNFNDPGTVDIINGWVSDNTNGKIETILDSIDPMAVMFLINAIYFNGTWTYEFDPDNTKDDTFTGVLDQQIDCKMMKIQGYFDHYSDEDVQIVDLPYGDGNYSMTILLPSPSIGINNFIADLNGESWDYYLQALEKDSGTVQMPRYKLEYELKMNDVLISLGMKHAFGIGGADFSRIAPQGSLYISEVRHKSFIETDEEGTEAAAVTIVELRETSAGPQPEVFYMRIDRPFLFVIREHHTGTLLFMGKITEPEL